MRIHPSADVQSSSIGEGAQVGAGAVVTRDVLPRTVVVGNPARTLKNRRNP